MPHASAEVVEVERHRDRFRDHNTREEGVNNARIDPASALENRRPMVPQRLPDFNTTQGLLRFVTQNSDRGVALATRRRNGELTIRACARIVPLASPEALGPARQGLGVPTGRRCTMSTAP